MKNRSATSLFDELIQTIQDAQEQINIIGAETFKTGAYDQATQLSEHGKQIDQIRETLERLKSSWSDLVLELEKIIILDWEFTSSIVSLRSPENKCPATKILTLFS